jgi:hypothetical protein
MEEQYNKVRELRAKQEEYNKDYRAIIEEFNNLNNTIIGLRQDNAKELVEAEEELRKKALEVYKANPTNKQLYGGVGIREKNIMTYDEKEAIEWSKENATMVFKFDNASFKAIAKTKPNGCPVVYSKEYSVTLPREMGE